VQRFSPRFDVSPHGLPVYGDKSPLIARTQFIGLKSASRVLFPMGLTGSLPAGTRHDAVCLAPGGETGAASVPSPWPIPVYLPSPAPWRSPPIGY
jgi:hypothetical protein